MTFRPEGQLGKAGAVLLEETLLDLRGHPRLSRWEEEFVTSLHRSLEQYGARMRLSYKQSVVLFELMTKTAAADRLETMEGKEAAP